MLKVLTPTFFSCNRNFSGQDTRFTKDNYICYCIRVGRTARAGRVGVSVSLAGEQERSLVKEIIKRAKNPVKNRIIPPDVIEKYNKKLQSLEPDVEKILQEEKNERELAKIENQANRAENLLKDVKDKNPRSWFQTTKERKVEKGKCYYFSLLHGSIMAIYNCELINDLVYL